MEDVKAFLFARWMSINYTTHTLNSEDDYWWKERLTHFNAVVYPNYLEHGADIETKKFLDSCNAIDDAINDLP